MRRIGRRCKAWPHGRCEARWLCVHERACWLCNRRSSWNDHRPARLGDAGRPAPGCSSRWRWWPCWARLDTWHCAWRDSGGASSAGDIVSSGRRRGMPGHAGIAWCATRHIHAQLRGDSTSCARTGAAAEPVVWERSGRSSRGRPRSGCHRSAGACRHRTIDTKSIVTLSHPEALPEHARHVGFEPASVPHRSCEKPALILRGTRIA